MSTAPAARRSLAPAVLASALVLLFLSGALGGCVPGDTEVRAGRPVPPIDRQVPAHLETATFAMG